MYLRLTRVTFAVKSNSIWPTLYMTFKLYSWPLWFRCSNRKTPTPSDNNHNLEKPLTNHYHITDEILLFLAYRFMFVCKDFFYLPHCNIKWFFLFWWILKSVEFLWLRIVLDFELVYNGNAVMYEVNADIQVYLGPMELYQTCSA